MALTKISSNLVADGAIVTGKIADGGVGTADLAANAVTSAKIAQNSILTKHIDDGQVDTAQIAADAITGAKIADDAISEEHLDVTVISSLTEVTAVDGDYVLIGDTSDSNNLKKVLVSSIRESADLLKTEATGDGSTVAYTLNEAPSSENATMVFFDGVYQHKSTYAVSGSTLTFDTAPLASTDIEIMASTTAALNVPADDSVQTAKIADNAVTSAKIASNSILTRHIDDDQITGDQLATNITISGNLITGGTIAPGGVLTANAGVVVDNITIDGTEIDLSSGDLTLDVAGDIILDADGGDIRFKDGGTEIGLLTNDSTNFGIFSRVDDADIKFYGLDNGSTIAALTLDMSEAGSATFNHDIKLGDNGQALFGAGDDLTIYHDGSDSYIKDTGSGNLLIQYSDLYFSKDAGSSHSVVFRSTGRVGIGTTGPDSLLHVDGSFSGTAVTIHNTAGSTSSDRGLDVETSTTGSTVQRWFNSGSELARVTGSGDLLVATTTAVSSMYNGVSGIGFGYSSGGYGAFVRSGTNTPLYVSTTGQGSGGFISFSQNGATRGDITWNGSNTLYNASSDYRLKEKVTPIENALSKVSALNPINFHWKENGEASDGFLAHEAQTIVPYAVTGKKDEVYTDENSGEELENGQPKYQTMDYGKLTPLLVKAVQEQQTIIDDLKSRIKVLEG